MSARPATAFPTVPQAAFLLLAHFLLQALLGAILYDLRGTLGLSEDELGALVMVLASGLVLVPVMQLRGMSHADLLHPTATPWLATLALVVPPVLMMVPLVILLDGSLMGLLHWIFPTSAWEQQAFDDMVAPGLASVLASCVLAPVLEEMLFRGVLLRSFLSSVPRWAAIAYSSLYFGAAHLNVYQFFFAFGLGLLLGWLFERSRSLIPCIALHAAVNTTVQILANAPGDDYRWLSPSSLPGWVAALAAATFGLLMLRRLFRSRQGGKA